MLVRSKSTGWHLLPGALLWIARCWSACRAFRVLSPPAIGRKFSDPTETERPRTKHWPTSGPSDGPKTLWQRPVGQGYAGLAVIGQTAVLFHRVENEERVEALDAASGKELWHFAMPTSYVSGISPDDGPRCVPLVHGDKVIVFGVQGMLACLRLADGKKEWSHDTHAEFRTPEGYFGAGSSPIVEGDKVIVNVGGAKAGAGVVAFSLASGKVLWQVGHDDASYSSPVAVTVGKTRHLIVETRLTTYSLDPENGNIRFQIAFGQRGPTVNGANPTVMGDHLFPDGQLRGRRGLRPHP